MRNEEELYFAGGCVWGVQEYCRYLPGVVQTTAGRANGNTDSTKGPYDGYSECVRIKFNPNYQSVKELLPLLFEVIDPYSINQQGEDKGEKYRTGVYSKHGAHLEEAKRFIETLPNSSQVAVEVLPLTNFVCSDSEHQDRLLRCPDDYCHIDPALLHKYKTL